MTFYVETWRTGSEEDPNGPNDVGVLAINKLLEPTLKNSTTLDVVANVLAALVAQYDRGNVSETSSPMGYKYVWDEEQQLWTLVCDERTTILITDGQNPKLAVLVVTSMTPS